MLDVERGRSAPDCAPGGSSPRLRPSYRSSRGPTAKQSSDSLPSIADGKDVPGATFDGLLNMLAQQHHHEVAQLRQEMKQLALARPMQTARGKTDLLFPPQARAAQRAVESEAGGEADRHTKAWARPVPAELHEVGSRKNSSRSAGDLTPSRRTAPALTVGFDGLLPGALHPLRGSQASSVGSRSPRARGSQANSSCNDSADTPRSQQSKVGRMFELLEAWDQGEEDGLVQLQPKSTRSIKNDISIHTRLHVNAVAGNLDLGSSQGGSKWPAVLIAHPTSPSRLAWQILGALLILSDIFRLPLELAFRPEETDVSGALDWITLLYWTLNMPAELMTGYVEHGLAVLSPRRILTRYLRTWFLVDVLVLVPDWIFTIGSLHRESEGGASQGYSRFLNVVRLARLSRLLRLLKLRKIHDILNEMITSEYVSILMHILTMILVLLLINHQISCAWFAVGDRKDSNTPSWTTTANIADMDDWVYMYAISFHWSISQFTPATNDVSPRNLDERIFAIIVVIFALVGFSYVVGSITGSLAQLRSMHAETSNLFWDLRRYLAKNKVSPTLSVRIQKYLEHAWRMQQERKPAKSIKLMALLSEQLDSELQCEMAVAQLQVHPFLAALCETSSVTVQRLANSAISHKLVASGDFLFYPGEAATHLWIVVEGSFEYSRVDAAGKLCREAVRNKEDWIAEPVLWTKWVHRGLLTAVEEGDELAIDGKKFCELVCLNPQAYTFASRYAHNFLLWLNGLNEDSLSDISQGEDVGDLVRSFMEPESDDDADPTDSEKTSTRRWSEKMRRWRRWSSGSNGAQHSQRHSISMKAIRGSVTMLTSCWR